MKEDMNGKEMLKNLQSCTAISEVYSTEVGAVRVHVCLQCITKPQLTSDLRVQTREQQGEHNSLSQDTHSAQSLTG